MSVLHPTSTGDLGKEGRNPLLYEFRLNYGSDRWAETNDWLFQLARHWALWQSPDIGTFPMDYRDPFGPASRTESEETGEDSAYYAIDDIIRELLEGAGATTSNNDDGGWDWSAPPGLRPSPATVVTDMIVHTTRVLMHLYHQLDLAGRSY